MKELWVPSIHWWELIFRSVLVYLFLIIVLRLTGKRQVGQLAPFDLVLLLVLSNAVQNSMNGGDNSVTGGVIFAAARVARKWPRRVFHIPHQKPGGPVRGRPPVPRPHRPPPPPPNGPSPQETPT